MCGIVGIYNKNGSLPENETKVFLKKSLEKMKRRGPDGQKSVIINNFYATGFVRLAIRDLSKNGMQPMQTDCGKYTITFNGEIYNTELLYKNLEPYNISFNSTTDTELILYHFKYFGFEKTINILDGIFAIAFYNLEKNELYLARDRAGTKPLYIYNDEKYLIYSSNYSQVVKNIFVKKREICPKGLASFIKLGYVPSNYGFFKNSFLLPQGSYVKIKTKTYHKPSLYYRYGCDNAKSNLDLTDVIKKSVNKQLVSDVPVGTFLSGGIDSSLVSLYANEKQKIKAFNIGFSNKKFDESTTAKEFANEKNIDFNNKIFDDINYLELIEDNIKAFSEPFSDFSSLPTLLLAKFAKEKVTVALSGDGGDELFYGYPRNIKYGSQADLLTASYFVKLFKILKSKILKRPLKLPIYEILSKPNKALVESNYITTSKKLSSKILINDYKEIFFDFLNNEKSEIKSKKQFLETLRVNEYYYHLQRILIKVDRASMYYSLETRVPLLSNEIIKTSIDYNFSDCTNNKKGKIPLRNILKKEVNGNLFNLPKKGFSMPIDIMINNDKSGIFDKYILASIPEIDALLNTKYIEKMYQNHKNQVSKYKTTSWLLWSIFSLKAWYINHIKN